MWDKIKKLAIMRDTERCLRKQQNDYSRPIIEDMDMMAQVLRWYDEYNATCSRPHKKRSSFYSFIAITVLLYYFVPSSLANYKIPKLYRREIAKLLDCDPTFVSHKKNDILFLYIKDKEFHREVSDAIAYIDKLIKK